MRNTRDSAVETSHGSPTHGEERFRLLVEGVADYAIFMIDPQGLILTWNTGAERINGYQAAEIIGQHISRFYPPEALLRGVPEHELDVATAEDRFEDEGWRIRKDGTRFWANVVLTALRDKAGLLRGFAQVTRDLTHRREHEEALRQSEERFRLLVEGVTDYAIFMLDVNGYVMTWNSGAERIKGYRADEIIGQHFSQFYPTGRGRQWVARPRASSGCRDGAIRGRRLAHSQRWNQVLGERHDHCAARCGRQAARVRQTHSGLVRAPGHRSAGGGSGRAGNNA